MAAGLNIIFAGTPDFAVPSLDALLRSSHAVCAVLTQPDRPAGRGRRLRASPVKLRAHAGNVPVLQPENLKHTEVQLSLRALQPDVMVVVAYGLLLPPQVLAIPRLGCINVHASLLPRWRGAAPIQRALLAGDRETGVTLMQMDRGLDTGAILAQAVCPIEPNATAALLHDRLAELGAATLIETLERLQRGAITPTPQDERRAVYAAKIGKAEARLDWSQSALALERAVRAFNPWPVAYTPFNGVMLRVWQAQALDEACAEPPGRVLRCSKQGIAVATGRGVLCLLQVQLPGGRPLSAAEFLNAHALDNATLG